MARSDRREVEVWADWLVSPARMGVLQATSARGHDIFAFEYDRAWLESANVGQLDPDLQLFAGSQYVRDEKPTFGVFLDSSPDRWGRVLMDRREAQLARVEKRRPRAMRELDYLLGVFDGHRMGGFRFRVGDGPFLDDNKELASPPWTSLRELEQASLHLEEDGVEDDPAFTKWLMMLVAPGRSLGGARPKASVMDSKGALWIAKFPSRDDVTDIGAWEAVLHFLARRAKITTAEFDVKRFGSKRHTFLSKRFDRAGTKRIHFASAMTLLGRSDGDDAPASYLDLAEVIARHGAQPTRDLEELWRRIVFNVCVSNVDDHLRNHGFLLDTSGWSLAPAYDMNPVAHGDGLALNISTTDNAQDLDLLREVAPQFRIKPARTKTILAEVRKAVQSWGVEAERLHLSRDAREQMSNAFRIAS
ncbi:MAG: type II toxin-antitoxin system HipA family toxin [Kofleriaceae bacterium]